MCDDAHVCHPSKWETTRRLDTPPARDPIGLPFSPSAIYFGSGCFSGVHAPDVPKRLPHRISITRCSYRYTFTAVRRQHDVLYSRNMGSNTHFVHHDEYLLGLLWSPAKQSQIIIHRLWTITGGDDGCSRLLATLISTLPIRYLGVPLVDRRLRISDWQPVLEKVESRLGGWRERFMSHGGRLVLLKAVLAAIPTYFMSIFRLPCVVQKRLEQLMRRFFWCGS